MMTPAATSKLSSWTWTWRRVWKKSTATWPVPQTQRTLRLCSTLWQTSSSKKTLKIVVFSEQHQSDKVGNDLTHHCHELCRVIGSRWSRPLEIQFNPHTKNHIWQPCVARQQCLAKTWANTNSNQTENLDPLGITRLRTIMKRRSNPCSGLLLKSVPLKAAESFHCRKTVNHRNLQDK